MDWVADGLGKTIPLKHHTIHLATEQFQSFFSSVMRDRAVKHTHD